MVNTLFYSTASLAWLLLGLSRVASSRTVYLAGDSTTARGNGIIQGWGAVVQPLMDIPIVNKAMGGRSARSYTNEGRFAEIAKLVVPGDIVVIEFGHNDGGSFSGGDNGRTDCPGSGSQTCQSTSNGVSVTVKTFPTYLTEAGKMMVMKGAKVVFASQTPNNIWEDGVGEYTPSRFGEYAKACAAAVGNGSTFVDHGTYVAKAWKALGKTVVDGLYPLDHTHTNEKGALIVAQAFTKAVLCSKDANLAAYVKSKASGAC